MTPPNVSGSDALPEEIPDSLAEAMEAWGKYLVDWTFSGSTVAQVNAAEVKVWAEIRSWVALQRAEARAGLKCQKCGSTEIGP